DGQRLISLGQDGTLKVWQAGTGRELGSASVRLGNVSSVALSPDGQRLAAAGVEGKIKIWDTASGQELRTLAGPLRPVTSLAFSPDGHRLASASGDQRPTETRSRAVSVPGEITLWDLGSGQVLRNLQGHTRAIGDLAFSPDGLSLASASW